MGQHHTAQTKPSYSKRDSIAFDYGEIFEIPEELGRLRVEWKIPEFLSLRKEIQRVVLSPTFNFLQEGCNLGIIPFSDKDSNYKCKIILFLGTLMKPVTYSVGIRQLDGTVDKSCSSTGSAFFDRDVLLKKQSTWLSSGVLTATLEIQSTEASEVELTEEEPEIELLWDSKKVKAKAPECVCLSDDSDTEDGSKTNGLNLVSKETQTEGLPSVDKEDAEYGRLEAKSISNLTKHFGDLLLEGRDHDVIINVQNRPFKAHKAVLQARSPVFASMFRHDMDENVSGTVSVSDCDPDFFGQFLRHVYTGKFEMDSAKSAVALYYAADKYDFQELKKACVRYLSESFTTTTVCDAIKMATVHGEECLLQKASSFFEWNLEEILATVEWQNFLQDNATLANEMLIRAVTSRSKRPEQRKIAVSLECPSCSVKRT